MLESLICPLIQSHCKQFTSNHQHGFFEARSTNTNLVTFESILSETIDSHGQADAGMEAAGGSRASAAPACARDAPQRGKPPTNHVHF
ncbi:unnamed protein product [Plutella xylostella]|uniref:(diamondback moth) hypothetical protein n=1 Tax=Plutella xylostella TaxID=51655 RepID=A0A8S4FN24_PLUXY|nr:unnamed protein product [Plutella xylostella]